MNIFLKAHPIRLYFFAKAPESHAINNECFEKVRIWLKAHFTAFLSGKTKFKSCRELKTFMNFYSTQVGKMVSKPPSKLLVI